MRLPPKKKKKKKRPKAEMNLVRLIDRFSCEEKCREFLERLRLAGGSLLHPLRRN